MVKGSAQAPDWILSNGRFWSRGFAAGADAMALRDGRIAAIGASSEIGATRGSETRVVDLAGRMVMPGIVDGHCHPVKGVVAQLFSCAFPFSVTPDEIAVALRRFVAEHPDAACVIGGRYAATFFDRFEISSPRRWLDAVVGDRPVYLREETGHNGWANSAALALLGLGPESPDPEGGTLVRGPDGALTGLLLEEADVWARAQLPDWSDAQYREAALEMVRLANAYGITGVTDADASEPLLRAYQGLDDEGRVEPLRLCSHHHPVWAPRNPSRRRRA